MNIEQTKVARTGGGLSAAGVPVPLVGVEIRGELSGAYASIRLRQTYENREASAIEAVYTFPVPSDATLTGFRMESGGRLIEGVVQPRDDAFRAYDDAVVTGHGAALLEQHRKNVFSAQVGNLLPGERAVIEVEYAQRVGLDEGSMRMMIPTLVAPRYTPDDVTPLATPPIGPGAPKATLDLVLDVGRAVEISSPSHALDVGVAGDGKTRVGFRDGAVPQDRDVVIEVRGAGAELSSTVASHRAPSGERWLALSVLPDLLRFSTASASRDVTFLIDTSGSMGGESIVQAKAALRLCLRHLTAGDRFNIVAFESDHRTFSKVAVPFSQSSLEAADKWVAALDANGGTELLAPLRDALKRSPRGIVVLLTDGQVGNEREILEASLAARETARVYSFGIGTAVSDQLLRDLATETHGAVEFIHPGERIEDKVVTVFSKAIAARVDDVTITFDGIDVAEVAPHALPPLVDADPWTLFARVERGTTGKAVVRGRIGAESFVLDVPMALSDDATNPAIEKLWASARIADLSRMKVDGRRADAMKARITELSVTHGVASEHASFVVVEQRDGERRRAGGVGETRVVPVSAPAGWAMPSGSSVDGADLGSFGGARATMGMPAPGGAWPSASASAPPASPVMRGGPPARAARPPVHVSPPAFAPPPPPPMAPMPMAQGMRHEGASALAPLPDRIIGAQLASGLWSDDPTTAGLRANAKQLWALAELSVTTAHPMFGTPLKKAIVAVLALVRAIGATDADATTLALGAAFLLASGRRTRADVETVAATVPGLAATFADEATLRTHLAALSTRL